MRLGTFNARSPSVTEIRCVWNGVDWFRKDFDSVWNSKYYKLPEIINTFSLTMKGYIHTNLHLEKRRVHGTCATVRGSKGSSQREFMSRCWRTVEATSNIQRIHLSLCCYSVEIQSTDIFMFFKVSNLLEKEEPGCRAVCTKFQICVFVCVCVRAIGTAPESITEWSKAHPFGEMKILPNLNMTKTILRGRLTNPSPYR
jgi:hypothetical protein